MTTNKPIEYKVTVKPDGREPKTYLVSADREGMAKTLAIAKYLQSENALRGEFVGYEVTKLSA